MIIFPDTWVPNDPSFPIVENTDVGGGFHGYGSEYAENEGYGHIQAVAASLITDGDTFVLDDASNPAVTFEFDTNASVVETPTLRAVTITGLENESGVAEAIETAVNAAPVLAVTANHIGGGAVSLVTTNGIASVVAMTQGGTSPLTVFGFMSFDGSGSPADKELIFQIIALNTVRPGLRRTGMKTGVRGNNVGQHIDMFWNGTTFRNVYSATFPDSVYLESSSSFPALDQEGQLNPTQMFVSSLLDTQRLQALSLAGVNNAAGFSASGRDSSGSALEAVLFAGDYQNLGLSNRVGFIMDASTPHFVVSEPTSAIDLLEVQIPTPGDADIVDYRFRATGFIGGGGVDGLQITIDGPNNIVTFDAKNSATILEFQTKLAVKPTSSFLMYVGDGGLEARNSIFMGGAGRPGNASGVLTGDGSGGLNAEAVLGGDFLNTTVGNIWHKNIATFANMDAVVGRETRVAVAVGDSEGNTEMSLQLFAKALDLTAASTDIEAGFRINNVDGAGSAAVSGANFMSWNSSTNRLSFGDADLEFESIELNMANIAAGGFFRFNPGGDGAVEKKGDNSVFLNATGFVSGAGDNLPIMIDYDFSASGAINVSQSFIRITTNGSTDHDNVFEDAGTRPGTGNADSFVAIRCDINGSEKWLRFYNTKNPA